MYYLGIILGSILAYFIGSVSWSIIIVRIRKGIDIRTVGSGNAGATNTFRVLGASYGLLVVFLDALKVPVAALLTFCLSLIPNQLFSETSYLIPAMFVLLGHCWPIYYGFKGGKAVACFIGLLFISNIWYFFIFLIIWFIAAGISRKVSVASIAATAAIFILVWFPWLHGINTFTYQWNAAQEFWAGKAGTTGWGWQNEWLRFDWMNYLHVVSYKFQAAHGMTLRGADDFPASGYAEGMLEMAICLIVGVALILTKHIPNMKRIHRNEEPVTFKKLSEKEKDELYELQHQPMPSHEERKRLKALEKKNKAEAKRNNQNGIIQRINQEIKKREAKYQHNKAIRKEKREAKKAAKRK